MFIKLSAVNSTVDTKESHSCLGGTLQASGIPECKLNFLFNFSEKYGCSVYAGPFVGVL